MIFNLYVLQRAFVFKERYRQRDVTCLELENTLAYVNTIMFILFWGVKILSVTRFPISCIFVMSFSSDQ